MNIWVAFDFDRQTADGSIRFYDLPQTKVHKAIRGLPDEVASLAFEIGEERRRYIWAASGKQVR
jgi:hypothetical protein